MALKTYKPTSPGRRLTTSPDFSEITKDYPEKSLTAPLKSTGGRNVYGRMTTRHRGGGHKQRMRIIDWKRDKDGVSAKVAAIEYDPNRSARLALLHYTDGEKRYNRWKGWRPTVRGLAMNPVDHPHGGGEGKSGQGNPHPVSPWGQPTKGYKTRVNKRTTKFIIKRRDKGVR